MILGVRLELALKSGVGYNQAFEGLGAPADMLEYPWTADWLKDDLNTGRGLNACYPTRSGATRSRLIQLKHVVLRRCENLIEGKLLGCVCATQNWLNIQKVMSKCSYPWGKSQPLYSHHWQLKWSLKSLLHFFFFLPLHHCKCYTGRRRGKHSYLLTCQYYCII